MTAKSGPIQAVLAAALILLASPARAETLNLFCEYEKGGSNEFVINFDQKTMQIAGSSKSPSPADISDRNITWKTTATRMDGGGGSHVSQIEISVNRTAGSVLVTEITDRGGYSAMSGKCRRATQKF